MAWDPADLLVQPGQLVRPIFNKFLEYLLAWRLMAGKGVLLNQTGSGVIVSARAATVGFTGAFFVSLKGNSSASVGLGLIGDGEGNNFEPTIGDKPISGDGGTQPALPISLTAFVENISWVALAAKFDPATGAITTAEGGKKTPLGLTVVQTGTLTPTPSVAYCPLALLRKDAAGNIACHQIPYFDLQHSVSQSGPGRPIVHFFDPL